MLYVRIELWPGGRGSLARLLHEGVIYNDATGTSTRGNYVARFSKKGGFRNCLRRTSDPERHDYDRIVRPSPSSVWREGVLSGFPRKKYGAWHLLLLCLYAAGILGEVRPEQEQA